MQQTVGLFLDGGHHLGRTVTGCQSADAASQVQEMIAIHVHYHGGTVPARSDPRDPFFKTVTETALPIYSKPAVIHPIIGGSGPNHLFIRYLNLPIATSGVGHPGSRAHAPNENIKVDLYLKGAQHAAAILEAFGKG